MKYKVLIHLFVIFLLIMLTVTVTGDKIRDFTSPTVAVMPLQEEIPNTAFINGSNMVYVLMERPSIFGKEQYLNITEVHKKVVNDVTSVVDYIYNSNAYIVIASDRPLKEKFTVKTAEKHSKNLIKSKYRDVIVLQTNQEYVTAKLINRIKNSSTLISDIWYQNGVSDNPYTTIYIKSDRGCSEILENQLNTLFDNVESFNIINIELRFQKVEFVLWMYFNIILLILMIYSLGKFKKSWGKLKISFHIDNFTYYIREIIERNYKDIVLTFTYAAAVCFTFFIFISFLPLPPIPARLIPEKLIYVGKLLDSVSEYNKMMDKHMISGLSLLHHLDFTFRVLWIGLIVQLVIIVIMFIILKSKKSRCQLRKE